MTKQELIDKVANASNLTKKDSGEVINLVFDSIAECLKSGDSFSLIGFGTFSVAKREARVGRNPKTGEQLNIPAKNVVKFKAGKKLKESV